MFLQYKTFPYKVILVKQMIKDTNSFIKYTIKGMLKNIYLKAETSNVSSSAYAYKCQYTI